MSTTGSAIALDQGDERLPAKDAELDYRSDYARWGTAMTKEARAWRNWYFHNYGRTPLPPEAFLTGYDGYDFRPFGHIGMEEPTYEQKMEAQGLRPAFFMTRPNGIGPTSKAHKGKEPSELGPSAVAVYDAITSLQEEGVTPDLRAVMARAGRSRETARKATIALREWGWITEATLPGSHGRRILYGLTED